MTRSPKRRSAGQALAEVALVAPLFFLMVFGILDIGRVVWANDVVGNAAREGARYASVHAGTELTDLASKDDIRDHTKQFVIAGGVNVGVTVCFSGVHIASYQVGCTGDVDETIGGTTAGYDRGNLVTVAVTTNVPTLLGSVFGHDQWTVRGESTVLINN
jgi:Flp pilus assembly protein TadG